MTALNVITFPARPDRLPPFVAPCVAANYIADPHEQARQLAEAEAEWEAPMAEDVPTLPEPPLVSERAFYLIGAAMSFVTALCVALATFGGVR